MIDTYPITKQGWTVLNQVHDRLKEMERAISFLATLQKIKVNTGIPKAENKKLKF